MGVENGAAADADLIAALGAELERTPYRPLRLLGQGGMGSVVEVEHRKLGRRFVVKFLTASARPDLEDRLRFEAQTLARITDPHLLAVTDFVTTESGRAFIVTEKLEGRTLREEVAARGRLPVDEAISLTLQVLRGLSVAHEKGLIHRDVKLDNLFLTRDGLGAPLVKVIDFGIAKIIPTDAGKAATVFDSVERPVVPTAEGMMLGTPRFMSPEQIRAEGVDARSDIYGVGGVLYQLLTGRGAFAHHKSLEDLILAQLTEVPAPPSSVVPNIPRAVDAVVLRALEKRPETRFANALEMSKALLAAREAPLSSPLSIALPPASPSPSSASSLDDSQLTGSKTRIATTDDERTVELRPAVRVRVEEAPSARSGLARAALDATAPLPSAPQPPIPQAAHPQRTMSNLEAPQNTTRSRATLVAVLVIVALGAAIWLVLRGLS